MSTGRARQRWRRATVFDIRTGVERQAVAGGVRPLLDRSYMLRQGCVHLGHDGWVHNPFTWQVH
jgi:hypothetical protein